MAINKILKGIAAGTGLGLGAMYLGNEGEGETFTSYPKEARGKRLLRGEQIPLPGLEGAVPEEKDSFGYGVQKEKPDLNEWSKKPWDMDQDVPLVKQALVSIFQSYHPDNKPFYVPGHSWDGKRNELLSKIIEASKNKEGFPEDMSLRDFGITDEIIGQPSQEGR